MKPVVIKIFFFIAILLLFAVVLDIISWIQNWSDSRSFEENKALYLAKFPAWLQDARFVTRIEIGLLAISLFAFWKARKAGFLKIIATILLALTGLLLFWLAFSLA